MTVASLCIRCNRTMGLVPPLQCAATQDFGEPWELLVVDWAYEERHEMLKAYWQCLRPDVPLNHVPPLPPHPLRHEYHCNDISTSFNTGFAAANGEIIAHLEDFWVFRPDWLRNLVGLVREHPDCVVVGNRLCTQPNETGDYSNAFDDNAPTHYGAVFIDDDTGTIKRHSPTEYTRAVMVNFAHVVKPFVDIGGFPEWPTRTPESFWVNPPLIIEMGMTYASTTLANAWHIQHLPGFAPVRYVAQYVDWDMTMRAGLAECHYMDYHPIVGHPHIQPPFPEDLKPYQREHLARARFGHAHDAPYAARRWTIDNG